MRLRQPDERAKPTNAESLSRPQFQERVPATVHLATTHESLGPGVKCDVTGNTYPAVVIPVTATASVLRRDAWPAGAAATVPDA